MANSQSAEKRINVNNRNRLRNIYYKSSVKKLNKMFLKNLKQYKVSQDPQKKEQLNKMLSSFYSLIDKGTKKNVFHKNTAAKKKSRLAGYLKIA